MYIVRDKNAKAILHVHHASLDENLTPEQVYADFDPATMEMGKLASGRLPKYFDIDADGHVVRLSKAAFASALIPETSQVEELIPVGRSVHASVKKQLAAKQLTTPEALQEARRLLNQEIGDQIAQAYTPGDEIKLMKGYMEWLGDGQPPGDEREAQYVAMQRSIARTKARYAPLKEQVQALVTKFR